MFPEFHMVVGFRGEVMYVNIMIHERKRKQLFVFILVCEGGYFPDFNHKTLNSSGLRNNIFDQLC